jgi:hypothetical protein
MLEAPAESKDLGENLIESASLWELSVHPSMFREGPARPVRRPRNDSCSAVCLAAFHMPELLFAGFFQFGFLLAKIGFSLSPF